MISETVASWLGIAALIVALLTVPSIIYFENRTYNRTTKGAITAALARWILLAASLALLLWCTISTDAAETNRTNKQTAAAVETKYGITLTPQQATELTSITESYESENKTIIEALGSTTIKGHKVILVKEDNQIYLLQKHNNTFIEYVKQ